MYRTLGWAFSLLLLTIAIASCNKRTTIGSDILPGEDDIFTQKTDTFQIKAWSEAVEVTNTSGLDAYLLGSLDDPIFGKSSASFFAEFRLPGDGNNSIDFGDTVWFDSIVMALRVVDFYGDSATTTEQIFNIKRISERMDEDSIHNSDTIFPTEPVALASGIAYIPNLKDSIVFTVENGGEIDTLAIEPPQLRVKLGESFGNSIFGLSGQSQLDDNDSWLDFMSGLYIETDTSGGFKDGIMTINPYSTYSGLNMHYRRQRRVDPDGDGVDSIIIDTLVFRFPIKSSSTSFFPSVTVGHYTHNYSGTVIEQLLLDTTDNDSILPIQGMQGIYTMIEIPNLDDLGVSGINKATLRLRQTGGTQGDGILTAPTRLFSYTGMGLDTFVNDLLLGEDHYGGGFEEVMADDGSLMQEYEINLTWHLQAILNGAIENRTLLIPFPYFRLPDRVILGGAAHPDERFRMELVITYTEIE